MEEWKNREPVGGTAAPVPEEGPAAETPAEDDFIARDYEEFTRRFPDVDPGELENDGMFRRFCGSRFGRESLAELYADFVTITRAVWEAARLSADDKRSRTTGTGGAGGGDSRLTAAQQRSLDEWNEANPGMKMTAREFLSR